MKNTKKTLTAILVILCCTLTLEPSYAKEGGSRKSATPAADTSGDAPAGAPTDTLRHRTGFGIAAVQGLTNTPTTPTMLFDLSGSNVFQLFFGVPGTSPFQFSLGMLFKHNLKENATNGFHLGGGFGAGSQITEGTTTAFATAVTAIFGFHFLIPDAPQIAMHFDAGPTLRSFSGKTDISIAALSPALGMSLLYMF
ncbi:hypothetical protein WDW86_16420 [Bdellovibrionota bacterium FG-2]